MNKKQREALQLEGHCVQCRQQDTHLLDCPVVKHNRKWRPPTAMELAFANAKRVARVA